MIHTEIVAPSVPWTIDVLEIDLTNPYVEIESAVANDRLGGGREKTSSMARRRSAPGHEVVGAINADFFNLSNGAPTHIQVVRGEILRREAYPRPAVGFDVENRVTIVRPKVGGTVTAGQATNSLDGVNEPRHADKLVLFNSYFGSTTGTNQYGTEARVRPLDEWITNDTVRVVVEEVVAGVGGMRIPRGEAVLSGHGTASTFLRDHAQVGDTLRLYQEVMPGLPALKEMVGGNPVVVENGAQAPMDPNASFNRDRHPRTAIGYSADSSKVYFITVDGRQSSSEGMNLFELADFMLRIGIAHGMNLDGGGSTAMVVRDEVVSSPSDGTGERSVANALLAISTAPRGDLSRILLEPTNAKLFMNKTVQFSVSASDEFFNPIPIDPSRVQYSADPELGTVTSTGLFTAGTSNDTGYVRVAYEGLVDSALVIVKTVARIEMAPERALTDTLQSVVFQVKAYDQDGLEQYVPAEQFQWTATNSTVGEVSGGIFRGRSEGQTDVVVSYQALADTAHVTVEVGEGGVVLDAMEDLEGWTLSGEHLDMAGTQLQAVNAFASRGERSFRIDYRFTEQASARNRVFLETDIPIQGVPDSIYVDVRSDGARHRVFYDLVDDRGNEFQAFVRKYANNTEAFDIQPASVPDAASTVAATRIVFPVRLKRINILLDYAGGRRSGETYSGTIYVDNLHLTYPARTVSADPAPSLPSRFTLFQNYPNPFQTSTEVRFAADQTQHVRLVLYDALGRARATVFDGTVAAGEHSVRIDGGNLPNGVYFLRPEPGQGSSITLTILR